MPTKSNPLEIFSMSNRAYDRCKTIVMTWVPAFIAAYALIAGTWGWEYTEKIVATLSALNALFGAILGLSTSAYKKKYMQLNDGQTGNTYFMEKEDI